MKYELDINEFTRMAKYTRFGMEFSNDALEALYDYYCDAQQHGEMGAIQNINDLFMEWDEYTNTKDIAEDYEIETDYEHGHALYDDQVQLYCMDEGMELIWVHDDTILLRSVV